MKRSTPTLERPNRVLGILAAVVVAWALLVPLPFLVDLADQWWRSPASMRYAPAIWPALGMMFSLLVPMAIVGLPLSLVFCFGTGYPAWILATRLGLKRRQDAVIVGIVLGLVLDLVLAALKYASLGPADAHREPLTKLLLFYPGIALYVAAVGAIAGLAAWWSAGTKSVDPHAQMARLFA